MPHSLTVLLMLLTAGAFAARLWLVVGRATAGLADADERRDTLRAAGIVMQLCLVCNGLGFFGAARIGAVVDGVPDPAALLWDQLAVLAGTAALLELVVRAVREETVLGAESPRLAWIRALTAIVERLLPRFAWAAVGLGTVFGIASGPGIVLFLAGELALMWAFGRLALALGRARRR